MRWFVVLLLLVNILFFALMQWGGLGGEDNNVEALAALNPEKIKLLGQPAVPQPDVSAVPVEPAPVVSVAPAVAPVAPSAPAAPAAPAPAPAPAPASASASAPVAATADTQHAGDKNNARNSCVEWGEFSGTDLARAEKALAQMNLGDSLSKRTVEYTHGYWVYLSPFKTHADKLKKIKHLKESGVADYFVVQESGRWMNAISLGVFKTKEAAHNFLGELNKKGVKSAKAGERASKFKFTVFVLKHIDAPGAAQLAAMQKDYAGSALKTVSCNQ